LINFIVFIVGIYRHWLKGFESRQQLSLVGVLHSPIEPTQRMSPSQDSFDICRMALVSAMEFRLRLHHFVRDWSGLILLILVLKLHYYPSL
jgi:hypothetical protein